MDIAQYLLISVLLSSGIICGYVLSFFVRSELKTGKKLIGLFQKLILVGLAAVLIFNGVYTFGTSVLIIAMLIFYFLANDLIFFAFGILIFLASFYLNVFLWVSVLLFLYSLLFGLLQYRKHPNYLLKVSALFFLSSFITYLFFWMFY